MAVDCNNRMATNLNDDEIFTIVALDLETSFPLPPSSSSFIVLSILTTDFRSK